MLSAQKPICSRRFLEIDPDFLPRMCCRPLLIRYRRNVFSFVYFLPIIWVSLRPEFPPKINDQIFGGEKKKSSVTSWQGHIEHVCKSSGYISRKRGELLTLNKFGPFILNQLVSIAFFPPIPWHPRNISANTDRNVSTNRLSESFGIALMLRLSVIV